MARPLRYLPPGGSFAELTSRTIQGRCLLRPSAEANELVLGVLGRALTRHRRVRLYAYVFLSNHYHMLVWAPNTEAISDFMEYVNSNLARRLGELYDWEGPFWGNRFHQIPVLGEVAFRKRLRYILRHGVKERLVPRPQDWPGASCVRALLSGRPERGVWTDRSGYNRALRRGQEPRLSDYRHVYEVQLEPFPFWEGLSPDERQARSHALLEDIVCEEFPADRSPEAEVLGVRGVLTAEPHSRPKSSKRSRAPLVHASSLESRDDYVAAYRAYVAGFRNKGARARPDP